MRILRLVGNRWIDCTQRIRAEQAEEYKRMQILLDDKGAKINERK